jgi:DNA-binding CsgD family transcriptional regulator
VPQTTAANLSLPAPAFLPLTPANVQDDSGQFIDLAVLWRWLVTGNVVLRSILCTESRTCALLEERTGASTLSPTKLAIFQRLLLGQSQKAVALDMGSSISTVSSAARDCLVALTCIHQPSRAPLLLFMAVHAAEGYPMREARLESAGPGRWLLLSDQPDAPLRDKLPAAELSAVRLLIEGRTYQEMAALRRTSPRTIANQLSAVFRKLGVSGRSELLSKLARGEGANPTNAAAQDSDPEVRTPRRSAATRQIDPGRARRAQAAPWEEPPRTA